MAIVKILRTGSHLFNLANCFTILRILLIPFMAWLLAYDQEQPPFEKDFMFRYSPGRMASMVVLLAGITDLLDGWIARKWKIESLLGKFLDPVADKLFLMVGLVMLMDLGRVSAFLVIALLSREFLITGLRGVAAGEGIIIAAGRFGKLKLIFQLLGLGLLMWYGNAFGLERFGIAAHHLGSVILYIALFISLFSGMGYLVDFFRALHRKAKLI